MVEDIDELADDLETAFLRLLTEDIGNESSLAFRNQISAEVAKHLAHQLARIAKETIEEHGDV